MEWNLKLGTAREGFSSNITNNYGRQRVYSMDITTAKWRCDLFDSKRWYKLDFPYGTKQDSTTIHYGRKSQLIILWIWRNFTITVPLVIRPIRGAKSISSLFSHLVSSHKVKRGFLQIRHLVPLLRKVIKTLENTITFIVRTWRYSYSRYHRAKLILRAEYIQQNALCYQLFSANKVLPSISGDMLSVSLWNSLRTRR